MRAFERRIGEGDANRLAGGRDRGRPARTLLKDGLAREERGGVAVRAEPEQHDLEQGTSRREGGRAVDALEGRLVLAGCLFRVEPLRRQGVDVAWGHGHVIEHGLAYHALVTARVALEDKALIA